MTKRGRKSSSELSLNSTLKIANADSRISPPDKFTDEEMAVWLEVVNSQPVNAFKPIHRPMLELYCRHIARARILSDEIMAFKREWLSDDDGLKRYDTLLKMAEREGRAASSFATRLRITRQAVEHRETAGTAQANHVNNAKPWDYG